MTFIESSYKSLDLQGFWKALCPLAQGCLSFLVLRAGIWISGNCFSVPKTRLNQGAGINPRCQYLHDTILASHEHFHLTKLLETWRPGKRERLWSILLSFAAVILCPLWISVEWVLGSVWWLEEVNGILYYFLQSRPSWARQPLLAFGSCINAAFGANQPGNPWRFFLAEGWATIKWNSSIWNRKCRCCRSRNPPQQVPVL